MKSRKNIILLIFGITLLQIFPAKSQVVSNINLGEVKNTITQSGKHSYQNLIKRLCEADTTLRPADFKDIYYGQIFEPKYLPLDDEKSLNNIQLQIITNKTDSADMELDAYLNEHPVSLSGIYSKMVILNQKKETATLNKWKVIYRGLIQAIIDSGDGKTETTAMVVAHVADEYKVLPALGTQSVSHMVTKKFYDEQTLDRPTKDGLNTLLFYITTISGKSDK